MRTYKRFFEFILSSHTFINILASTGLILFQTNAHGEQGAGQQGYESNLVEALYYTNIARQESGLRGLAPSDGLERRLPGQSWGPLQQAAFNHARDMAERNYFSHYTPEG